MKVKELMEILKDQNPDAVVKYNGYNAMINADHEMTSGMVEFSLDKVCFSSDKEVHFAEQLA